MTTDYYPPGYEPRPSMEFPESEPVEIEVETVYGLGLQMRGENENFRPRVDAIAQQFGVNGTNQHSGQFSMAVGLASISPQVRSALEYTVTSMERASEVMRSQSDGQKALANMSMLIASRFSGTDALNAADIETIRDITGIPPEQRPDYPSRPGGGPIPV
ncbi:hypothetical protein LX16_5119 [Stackebrandtia albiflava]|uniref:Uncharacterized protein n=1 Tax=Stackebrandtia albiflava TaxID=406432 RepID=A0A562UPT2_9ACTN|nr:hypothetical protein [Stackebrandtia albiflava]TWJ07633.1 hypothetical protein LX16_5119 [Stackebrandtia albiflava]